MAMQTRLQDCGEFSTPIYRLFMDVVGRLLAQDPVLTAEICLHNPETMSAVRIFQEWADRWANLIAQGDLDGFVSLFREISNYFGKFCNEASGEIDFLLQALPQRQSHKPVDLGPKTE